MTDLNELNTLKLFAKRIARAKRIRLHQSLDDLAKDLGHAHWNALTLAHKKGWKPPLDTLEQLGTLPAYHGSKEAEDLNGDERPAFNGGGIKGSIDGHDFVVSIDFGEVFMRGKCWHIHIDQPPSKPPSIQITDRRFKNNPVNNPDFVAKALVIAEAWAEKARTQIAEDWPRRSTQPDKDGIVRHPLFGGESATWHCLHCDGQFAGVQIAKNFWHCPNCSATPLDIFSEPFWEEAS